MDTNSILQELRAQRDRIDKAVAALEGLGPRGARNSSANRSGKRRLSAAARRRISEAQKARWARQKRKSK